MSEAKGAKSEKELVAELRQLIKGDICSQFDPDYHREVRKAWNARLYEKKPLLFVYVECQDDILETLKFCKSHKVESINSYIIIYEIINNSYYPIQHWHSCCK